MIKQLNINNEILAHGFLKLQKLAYQVEAELIDYKQLPPLQETAEQLLESTETYFGYYVADKLVGALSYEQEGPRLEGKASFPTTITICKMIVHPQYFKRGIASQLLQFLLEQCANKGVAELIVSTGVKNTPAIQLYQKFGFVAVGEQRIDARLSLLTLKKQWV